MRVDDKTFSLAFKEALYIGSGDRNVVFESEDKANPAKLYFNSAVAHTSYPCKKITKADAVSVKMGALETGKRNGKAYMDVKAWRLQNG